MAKSSKQQQREQRRAERKQVELASDLEALVKQFNKEFPRRPRKPIIRKRKQNK